MSERFNPYHQFVGSFIPNSLMRFKGLSATAKLTWARLAQYAGKNGECFPSQGRIAEEVGVSRRYIKEVLKELVEKGFLEKESPNRSERMKGKTCKYFFLKNPILQGSPPGEQNFPRPGEQNFPRVGNKTSPGWGTNVPIEENQEENQEKASSLDSKFEESKKEAKEILRMLREKVNY